MDPLSIATACVSLLSGITTVSKSLASFVSTALDARKDIDGFSRELSSLALCVATLKNEEFRFPDTLQKQLVGVLQNCGSVTQGMSVVIERHRSNAVGRKLQWSFSDRDEVSRLRERLEAHKSVLEITLELANLSTVNTIKEDTSDIKVELAALKLQVMQLRSSDSAPGFALQRFLNETVAYTESVVDPNDSRGDDEGFDEDSHSPAYLEDGHRSRSTAGVGLSAARRPQTSDVAPHATTMRNAPIERALVRTDTDTTLTDLATFRSYRVPRISVNASKMEDAAVARAQLSRSRRTLLDEQLELELVEVRPSRSRVEQLLKAEAEAFDRLLGFRHIQSGEAETAWLLMEYGYRLSNSSSCLLEYLLTSQVVSIDVIKALLQCGAEARTAMTHITRKNLGVAAAHVEDGVTPLHLAVADRSLSSLVGLFVAEGADVNAVDDRGLTPLHVALLANNLDAIRQLLSAGAAHSYTAKFIRDQARSNMLKSFGDDLHLARSVSWEHQIPIVMPKCKHYGSKSGGQPSVVDCMKCLQKLIASNFALIETNVKEVLGSFGMPHDLTVSDGNQVFEQPKHRLIEGGYHFVGVLEYLARK